jgi:hypothetical protein
MTRNCQTSPIIPTGTTTRNPPRQPINPPRKLPSGAATTEASAVPPCSRAIALGKSAGAESRARIAVDSDQKPPMAMPTRMRPSMKTANEVANAVSNPEATSTAV